MTPYLVVELTKRTRKHAQHSRLTLYDELGYLDQVTRWEETTLLEAIAFAAVTKAKLVHLTYTDPEEEP